MAASATAGRTDDLRAGTDIVVATPGRLLDHLEQGTCGWTRSNFSCSTKPTGCSTWDFCPTCAASSKDARASATPRCFPPPFRRRLKRSSNGRCTIRKRLRSARAARRPKRSSTSFIPFPIRRRPTCCSNCSKRVNYNSVLVFCRTKHGADRVATLLKRNNHAVAVLHSNRTQREREQALRGFPRRHDSKCSSPRTSPRADWTSRTSATSSTTTCRSIRRITSTASGAPAARKHTGDAFTIMIAEDAQPRLRHRTLHQPENPAREAGEFRLPLHRAV